MVLLLSSRRLRDDFLQRPRKHPSLSIASEILHRAAIYDGQVFILLSSDCRIHRFVSVFAFLYIRERILRLFRYIDRCTMLSRVLAIRVIEIRCHILATSCYRSVRYALSLVRIFHGASVSYLRRHAIARIIRLSMTFDIVTLRLSRLFLFSIYSNCISCPLLHASLREKK